MDSLVEIRKSTNYDWFKFLPTNRSVGTSIRVKESVKIFDMTPYVPIITTSDGYIIDGQNRFEACRQLGKPVYYVIYDGEFTPEQAMIALNTAAKPWTQEDWFQHYVKNGIRNYVRLAEMMKYQKIGISNAILLFSNNKTNADYFKRGKLIDDSKYFYEVCDFLKTCNVPYKTYRAFVNAVLHFIEKYHGNKRKISRLNRKVISVPKFSSVEQFSTAFENLTK